MNAPVESSETAVSHRFDDHTRIARVTPGRYVGTLTEAWNIGPVPNGGYQMAVASRAALDALQLPDVVSVSSYFLSASEPGPVTLSVEIVKRGRNTSVAQVSLLQGERERLRALVLAGDLTRLSGPELHRSAAPELPPPEACLRLTADVPVVPKVMNEVELRFDPETAAFVRGEIGAPPEFRGWMRFADGRPTDSLALIALADVLPPTSFNAFGIRGWVPTLEMTTQLRRRPAPGWLRVRMVTRHFSAGHFEEDGELFDENGELVALSRQRALLL